MQGHIYVGLSAQRALLKRLDTLAQNLANISTVGYRAEEVTFASLLSQSGEGGTKFVSPGESYTSLRHGGLTQTSNPLDVAISGEGWLATQGPDGRVLSRDGRLKMSASGELLTVTGSPVLDPGGAPIRIEPNAGPPTITREGKIIQNGRHVASIGIFVVDPEAKITRVSNSSIATDRPPVAQLDFNAVGVVQGYVERSNVDPVGELTRLVTVQRLFDSISSTMNEAERSLTEAVRTLGTDR